MTLPKGLCSGSRGSPPGRAFVLPPRTAITLLRSSEHSEPLAYFAIPLEGLGILYLGATGPRREVYLCVEDAQSGLFLRLGWLEGRLRYPAPRRFKIVSRCDDTFYASNALQALAVLLAKAALPDTLAARASSVYAAVVAETESLAGAVETIALECSLATPVVRSPQFNLVLTLSPAPHLTVIDFLSGSVDYSGISASIQGLSLLDDRGRSHGSLPDWLRELRSGHKEFTEASLHDRLSWIAALDRAAERLEAGDDLRSPSWVQAGSPWGSAILGPVPSIP